MSTAKIFPMRLINRVLLLIAGMLVCFSLQSEQVNISEDKRTAGHPATPESVLRKLLHHPDVEVRETLGRNRRASQYLLDQLASDRDARVRIAVATNLTTSEKTLAKLAGDKNKDVRSVVARFEYVPASVLSILSKDPVVDIRLEVVRNLNVARDTLIKLKQDKHPEVSSLAILRLQENSN